MRNRLTRALGLGALISLPLVLWQSDGDLQGELRRPQAAGRRAPMRSLAAAIDCPRHDERVGVAPDSIPPSLEVTVAGGRPFASWELLTPDVMTVDGRR